MFKILLNFVILLICPYLSSWRSSLYTVIKNLLLCVCKYLYKSVTCISIAYKTFSINSFKSSIYIYLYISIHIYTVFIWSYLKNLLYAKFKMTYCYICMSVKVWILCIEWGRNLFIFLCQYPIVTVLFLSGPYSPLMWYTPL